MNKRDGQLAKIVVSVSSHAKDRNSAELLKKLTVK